MSDIDEILSLVRGVQARILSDRLAGVDVAPYRWRTPPLSRPKPPPARPKPAPAAVPPKEEGKPPPAWPGTTERPSRDPSRMPENLGPAAEEKRRRLVALEDEMGDCVRCGLGWRRRCLVFGAGNPDADVMFVGEGPGFNEDRSGEPFVGAAGQILTRIIENVLNLRRKDVYIANVVKCRPPNNRDPKPEETEACSPYLLRQIEIVQPAILVPLGSPAAKLVLQTESGITNLRGKWAEAHGTRVMPTFHPAYLLHNNQDKRLVFQDMLQVKAALDELGARG